MIRDDLSQQVVHLTKGEPEQAWKNFVSIITSKSLRGGIGGIRCEYPCVCFTETPIAKLGQVLAHPSVLEMRYAPLGIMMHKTTLFAAGGRPVIYQPDYEFELLHDSMRYKHKGYDPQNGQDYSWEREWRIQTDEFRLDPALVTLVVPNRACSDRIIGYHTDEMKRMTLTMGDLAHYRIEKSPWNILVLEDLGITIQFDYVPG